MSIIQLGDLTAEMPENWDVQGMLTLTLPSPDPNVKPNVILTKERLPGPIELSQYFNKIKESIQQRNIRDFKITDERDVVISGVRGKMMVCRWDVSAMAEILKQQNPAQEMPQIKPGQIVKQVQVTLLKDQTAINMTASFPDDKFDIYYRPFQQFLKTLKIS